MKELNIYLNETNEENKEDQFNESGNYFDYNLFYNKTYNIITRPEAEFFLNINNYNNVESYGGIDESIYREKLEKLYQNRLNKGYKGFCLKLIKRNSEPVTIGKCASFFRNNS